MVLTVQTSVSKVMSLLFNMLSRFVIAFLPRSKLSFNFMAAVTNCSDFGAQENKICHCFHFFLFYLPEVMELDAMILVFVVVVFFFFYAAFQASFSLSSFTLIKRLFSFSSLSLGRCHLHMRSKE